VGEFAERQSVPGGPEAPVVKELSRPLFEAKGWMKLLGVLMIIDGVFIACIPPFFGIIIAWLPIWMGILLFSVGSKVDAAFQGGNKTDLAAGLGKLKTYFMIQGILAIIGIVFLIVGLIVAGGALMAVLAGGGLEALRGTTM